MGTSVCVLQCVAASCSVLQSVKMENEIQSRTIHSCHIDASQVVWVCRWGSQCVLQCVAASCSVLQYVAVEAESRTIHNHHIGAT